MSAWPSIERRSSARMRASSSRYTSLGTTSSAPLSSARTRTIGSAPGSVEDDDRDVPVPGPPRLSCAEPAAELGLARDHDVGREPLGEVERPGRPRGLEDREAVVAELPLEVPPRVRLVLGQQDGVRPTPRR